MQKNTGQGEGRLRQARRESGRRGPAPPGPTDSLNPHRLAVSLLFAEQEHLQGDGAPMAMSANKIQPGLARWSVGRSVVPTPGGGSSIPGQGTARLRLKDPVR